MKGDGKHRETGAFDPDREVRVDELPTGSLILHQDDPEGDHPLAKTASLIGAPVSLEDWQ